MELLIQSLIAFLLLVNTLMKTNEQYKITIVKKQLRKVRANRNRNTQVTHAPFGMRLN